MKNYLKLVGLLLSLGGISLGGLSEARAASPLDHQKLVEELKEHPGLIIDVREKKELANGQIEGAKWLATSEIEKESTIFKKFVSELPKDKTIYVYCAVGGRAGKFVDLLRAKGFKAENAGGIKDLKEVGLPVVNPK